LFGRWVGCLNQDLLDFGGFAGWRVSPGTGVVVRVFTSVHKSLREIRERWLVWALSGLSESGFAGFWGIYGMVGVSGHGWGRMSVYESSREICERFGSVDVIGRVTTNHFGLCRADACFPARFGFRVTAWQLVLRTLYIRSRAILTPISSLTQRTLL